MKKIILLLTIFCFLKSHSQKVGETYEFIINYNHADGKQFKKGHKVVVTDSSQGNITFEYLKFALNKSNETISSELNNNYYYLSSVDLSEQKNDSNIINNPIQFFTMEASTFNKVTTKYYARFKGVIAGAFTVPFKIRLNDFDFEQNVNIGMNLGFPFRINRLKYDKWLLTPTLGIGLSTVNLNPENSDLISGSESENRTASALTLSTGLMIQFSNTINLGFQLGFDYLSNSDKSIRWKYDRKPWLGIGINIGISVSETKNSSSTQ